MTAVVVLIGQTSGFAAWMTGMASGTSRQLQAGTLGTVAAPTVSQVAGGRTVQVTWGAAALATSYEVLRHTVATGGTGTVACTSTGTSCTDPTAVTGSSNWYSVVARVGTAWVSQSPRTPYTADDSTTVAISAIAGDSGTSSSDFITNVASTTLSGTAEAGATIVVRRSGSTIATATASPGGTWTSTTFTLVDGLQSLDATATDGYGNTSVATRSGVRLDTTAPSTSASAPCSNVGNAAPSGSWCKVTSLSLTASFSDGQSGLAAGTSQYQDNGGGWTAYSGALSLPESNGRVIQLRATDLAGNVGTSSTTYYIDVTAPSLTTTAPTDGLSVSLAVLGTLLSTSCGGKTACGTSSDATSGLPATSSVKWQLKKGSQCLLASGSYGACALQDAVGTLPSWSTSTSGGYSVLSSYVLTVTSTDAAGNVATVTVSFATLL